MKFLKLAGIGLLVCIAVVMLLAVNKPDAFRVQRSVSIQAPSGKIFALINDFHQWQAWSPWEKLDPAMKRSYSGPASGVGAAYAWEGDSKVGAGRMEIRESTSASRVLIDLLFAAPMETHNTAEFLLQEQAGATTVTWTMQGPNPFLGKVMQVFLSMDDMVGKDFEKGLAGIKAVAEQ